MMKLKHVLAMVAAPLALMAAPADAAVFAFTLTGAYTASFEVEEGAFLSPVDFGDYFEVNGTGTIGGRTGSHIIAFNTTAFDGGLTLGDEFTNLWGPQLFTGTITNPVVRAGAFTLLLDGQTGRTVSLNISAVPEPMTWALMVVGFGAVGAAMRRRRMSIATA